MGKGQWAESKEQKNRKRLGENFSESIGRGDGAQGLIFQQAKYGLEEIRVGSYILNKINERGCVETDCHVLFDSASKLKRVSIHRVVYQGRRQSWSYFPRFPCLDRAGVRPGSWV